MNLQYTTQFKKDYKRIKKQKKDTELLKQIIELILSGKPLPPIYKDHKLTGNWSNHRNYHIQPDWILIYRKTEEFLILERMGSHSDLFK